MSPLCSAILFDTGTFADVDKFTLSYNIYKFTLTYIISPLCSAILLDTGAFARCRHLATATRTHKPIP